MQEINRKTIKYFMITVIISIIFIIIEAIAGESNLANLLPQDKELGKNVTSEYQQAAKGEKLVELINGGAVQFFRHGFQETIFQEYYIDSTQYINLEIYKMQKPQGSKGIFLARIDTTAAKISVGQQGFKGDYFCTFYRNNYYVIATGSDSTQAIQNVLLKAMKVVDKNIVNKIALLEKSGTQ